ncbi:MAG: ribbon-helix-helix protein, CopG family [Syntrophomonadaceae bacterium]|nr:ribbon-helix-helix protein, CopG family [Syntrophomonadaceae bacterium]
MVFPKETVVCRQYERLILNLCTVWYLTKKQVERIKALAEEQQISRSALVRIIITDYLSRNSKLKGKVV